MRGQRSTVSLCVIDTGIGIPADKLGAIFDPFVQVNPRLNNSNQGVGLGLSISRELARALSGDLTAASTQGQGSAFTIIFPRSASVRS